MVVAIQRFLPRCPLISLLLYLATRFATPNFLPRSYSHVGKLALSVSFGPPQVHPWILACSSTCFLPCLPAGEQAHTVAYRPKLHFCGTFIGFGAIEAGRRFGGYVVCCVAGVDEGVAA